MNGVEMNIPRMNGIAAVQSQIATPSIYVYGFIVIFCATVLQKICLPGISDSLAVSTLVAPTVTILGFITGALQVNLKACIAFSIFILVGIASVCLNLNSGNVSISSIYLVLLVQFPLIFRPKDLESAGGKISSIYRDTLVLLCIGGICQFWTQFIIGTQYAFFIDYLFPSMIVMKGFGNINTLMYGSATLKSNGIVFLEPSFFGQYLAVGAIIEILTKQRVSRLMIFSGALLCSFSGTGLVTLALFGGYIMMKRKSFHILISLFAFTLFIYALGDLIGIEAITGRTNELSTPGSSGHLRFVTPFQLIDRFVLPNFGSLMIGRGPGAFNTYKDVLEFGATDATWSKIVLEYGFIGLGTYIIFMYYCVSNIKNPLLLPILFVYTFLGGYLTNAPIVSLILVLLVWINGPTDEASAERSAVPQPSPAPAPAPLRRLRRH